MINRVISLLARNISCPNEDYNNYVITINILVVIFTSLEGIRVTVVTAINTPSQICVFTHIFWGKRQFVVCLRSVCTSLMYFLFSLICL